MILSNEKTAKSKTSTLVLECVHDANLNNQKLKAIEKSVPDVRRSQGRLVESAVQKAPEAR
jgi:hypothetical protein